jgi:hypothetical protein
MGDAFVLAHTKAAEARRLSRFRQKPFQPGTQQFK